MTDDALTKIIAFGITGALVLCAPRAASAAPSPTPVLETIIALERPAFARLREGREAALDAERARLAPLADAITEAVDAPDAPLPWPGPAARAGAAYALVAIAWHESGFRADVISCKRRGPSGDATAFQLLGSWARGGHTVAEVCASLPLAASRALAVLAAGGRRCSNAGGVAAFQGYASGTCGRPAPVRVRIRGVVVTVDHDAGATRCRTWERIALAGGISGATCHARPFLTPADDESGAP